MEKKREVNLQSSADENLGYLTLMEMAAISLKVISKGEQSQREKEPREGSWR